MKMKRYVACLLAGAMLCGLTACSGKTESSVAETEPATEAEETTEVQAVEVTEAETVVFEEAKDAQPGQAYLAIVDGQWWIQYWGSSTKDGYMLSYDAGIADIKGDGTYTVSVNADTNGFRYDATGDVNGEYTPGGLNFLAVMIPEGETMYPGAVITVDSIKVDGNEIEMKGKNYTSSDDGVETRTNLYNAYVAEPSKDGRSVDGPLYDPDGNALEICADYTPNVVDPADFAAWTKVEVTFTISGIDGAAPAEGGDASAAEGEGSAEESAAEGAESAEESAAEGEASTAEEAAESSAE